MPGVAAGFVATTGQQPILGGILTYDSTYYYRTFKANGSLIIASPTLTFDYILVAAGGAASIDANVGFASGGGGGGGVLHGNTTKSAGSYPIVIGAGVTGSAANGNSSTALGLTAIGGGRGHSWNDGAATTGGSGGGGKGYGYNAAGSGAAGTAGQGNSGTSGTTYGAGGGGGAGSPASAPSTYASGNGGNGYQWVNGSYYGGGGGGSGKVSLGVSPGLGGLGGGSNGNTDTVNNYTAIPFSAAANTGGGMGASAGQYSGGTSGSGVFIIRYTRSQVGG